MRPALARAVHSTVLRTHFTYTGYTSTNLYIREMLACARRAQSFALPPPDAEHKNRPLEWAQPYSHGQAGKTGRLPVGAPSRQRYRIVLPAAAVITRYQRRVTTPTHERGNHENGGYISEKKCESPHQPHRPTKTEGKSGTTYIYRPSM